MYIKFNEVYMNTVLAQMTRKAELLIEDRAAALRLSRYVYCFYSIVRRLSLITMLRTTHLIS
jgi:hypothetical protein